MTTAKYGAAHGETLHRMFQTAKVQCAAGNLKQSLPLLEKTLKMQRQTLGPDHDDTLESMNELGTVYEQMGKYELAEAILREALDVSRRTAGTNDRVLSARLAVLGLNLLRQKKFAEAEKVIRECLAVRDKVWPDEWTTFNTKSTLGGTLLGQKKYAQAEPLLVAGYEEMKQREAAIPPAGKPRLTEALERLVQLYEETKRPDEAAKWREELEKRREANKAESGELRVESQTRQEAKKQEAKKQDVKKQDAKKG
jgi:tetratricopeptide (TPR) repeat protein